MDKHNYRDIYWQITPTNKAEMLRKYGFDVHPYDETEAGLIAIIIILSEKIKKLECKLSLEQ